MSYRYVVNWPSFFPLFMYNRKNSFIWILNLDYVINQHPAPLFVRTIFRILLMWWIAMDWTQKIELICDAIKQNESEVENYDF